MASVQGEVEKEMRAKKRSLDTVVHSQRLPSLLSAIPFAVPELLEVSGSAKTKTSATRRVEMERK